MKILSITILAIILTFSFDLVFRKSVEKRPFKVGRRKIHHSVLGLLLFAIGIASRNPIILSIGLGMYLSHGIEEMYFNKTRIPGAFFVFVTRA